MSLEFYKTQAGRRFYDGTMTRIADSLERIATCLEEQQTKSKEAAPDSREMMDAYPPGVMENNFDKVVDMAMKEIAELNQAHVDKIRKENGN